jgi:hypothetical protein
MALDPADLRALFETELDALIEPDRIEDERDRQADEAALLVELARTWTDR